MREGLRSGAAFAGAVIMVFGTLYLLDRYGGWSPSVKPESISEPAPLTNESDSLKESREGKVGPLPKANEPPLEAKRDQIFRCEVDGKTVYADAPCEGHRSTEVRIGESSGVTIVDPRKVEEFRNQALAPASGKRVSPHANVLQTQVAANRGECDLVDQEIRRLDEIARQPLSARRQDRIKHERKLLVQRRHDLNCLYL